MNPTSGPLVGAPQAPGVYPGVPVGQWGTHPVPHGQVNYSAPAIPGGVAPFPGVPPTAPSYTPPSKSSKQSKTQVRRCSENRASTQTGVSVKVGRNQRTEAYWRQLWSLVTL